MKRIITAAILTIFLSAPLFSEYEKCRPVRIVDGDTLIVEFRGKHERLRLTGIDTPEASVNDKALRYAERKKIDVNVIVNQGRKASEFAESLLAGEEMLFLEFDLNKRDRY